MEEKSAMETFFQFVQPFRLEVWLILLLVALVTSTAYLIAEEGNEDDFASEHRPGRLGESVTLALFQFTGAGGYNPKTITGRIIVFAWSFTVLLTTTAYTANLATFLITRSQDSFGISSIQDAEASGARICVVDGYAVHTFIQNTYPDVVTFLLDDDDPVKSWEALAKGDCVAEATTLSAASDRIDGKSSWNPKCQLALTPSLPFQNLEGGWVSKSDNGIFCTGLVRDVLELYTSEMVDEQYISDAFKELRDTFKTQDPKTCSQSTEQDDTSDGLVRLDLGSMGGIYLTHTAFILIAAVVGLVRYHLHNKKVNPSGEIPPDEGTKEEVSDQTVKSIGLDQRIENLESKVEGLARLIETKLDRIVAKLEA